MRLRLFIASLGLVTWLGPTALLHAQSSPPTGRTVFRCDIDGKVTYGDAPCAGAQKVDLEPTRGLSVSGRERPETQVQKAHPREAVDEASRPPAGTRSEETTVVRRRQRLSPTARAECGRLDQRIAGLEQRESIAPDRVLVALQDELLIQRTRYRELRC